jgi:hypothetical protein
MASLQLKYPSTSSVVVTCTLTSLASSTTFIAGRASTAIDNTTNLDIDHLLSGIITVGTTPTAATNINVYLYANISSATGTPTYPETITGTDAAKSIVAVGNLQSGLRLACSITVAATTARPYSFGPISVASFYGGVLPKFWGIFVAHNGTAALNATATNHVITYERVQYQTV